MHSAIEVPRDHPSFAGHFPHVFPSWPGAVLLDAALQVIRRERGIDLTQCGEIASVKFLDVVRPGDALRLGARGPQERPDSNSPFRVADRTVARRQPVEHGRRPVRCGRGGAA